jgi:hypothetical protein
MARPTAVHVAATHDHICRLKQREQAGQVSRIVREVGIHLDDDLIGTPQGPLKASDVSGDEAQFASAGEEMHLGPILVLHRRDLVLRTVPAMIIPKQDVNGGSGL